MEWQLPRANFSDIIINCYQRGVGRRSVQNWNIYSLKKNEFLLPWIAINDSESSLNGRCIRISSEWSQSSYFSFYPSGGFQLKPKHPTLSFFVFFKCVYISISDWIHAISMLIIIADNIYWVFYIFILYLLNFDLFSALKTESFICFWTQDRR